MRRALLQVLGFAMACMALAHTPAQAQEKPEAVATFHCMSLYWKPDGASADRACTIRYRAVGDKEWREGYPLWFDDRHPEAFAKIYPDRYHWRNQTEASQPEFSHQYRGSIVNLKPDTEYEIELRLEGTDTRATVRARTWSETFPVGRTIRVPAKSAEPVIVTEGGSADAYVLVAPEGDSATIDIDDKADCCVEVRASYVIVRGLTLKNAHRHGVGIYGQVHDVVVEGCDISGWGSKCRQERELWGKYGQWGTQADSGVFSEGGDSRTTTMSRLVIQRNRIHHPRYDTNAWSEYRKKADKQNKGPVKGGRWHPYGPQGISLHNTAGNIVIRYNTIASDKDHYYNDGMGGSGNYSGAGFPRRDSDIYGNDISGCWDDAIESEGANCNVRIWDNYLHDSFNMIATACTHIGPLYIFRNVSGASQHHPGDDSDKTGRGVFLKAGMRRFKDDEIFFGGGRTYLFHNTIWQPPIPEGKEKPVGVQFGFTGWGGAVRNHVSRNNVVDSQYASSIKTKEYGPDIIANNDFDHDLLAGKPITVHPQWAHAIKGKPIYADDDQPKDFTQTPDSPGYDAGVRLPNFNDNFTGKAPDMGAQEAGKPLVKFGVNGGK